jgi:hypothetical protein
MSCTTDTQTIKPKTMNSQFLLEMERKLNPGELRDALNGAWSDKESNLYAH